MAEIRACMYNRSTNKIKVPQAGFDRIVEELKKEGRQVCFEAPRFNRALGTTIPEKTEVEGDKIFCGMYVPSRVVKWAERGKQFSAVYFVSKVIFHPQQLGMQTPAQMKAEADAKTADPVSDLYGGAPLLEGHKGSESWDAGFLYKDVEGNLREIPPDTTNPNPDGE